MKIAMVGQKGVPALYGGIERHVDELSRGLVKLDQEVFAYCRPWYGRANISELEGIKPIYTPSIKTKHLDAISHTFISLIHASLKDFDIIHIHGVGPALMAWLPKVLNAKAKVIVTFHCIDRKHQKWGFIARTMLRLGEWCACRFADRTITVSRTLHQYCSEAYDSMTQYIPNGINRNSCEKSDQLKQFGIRPKGYIVMISRLVRHKGAHYLIEAYKTLKSRNPEVLKDKKLVFVGDSAFTDDYVKELKRLAADDEDIIFTGFQSGETLKQLFANAYLFVHPSESEGLPIAVLEAMSYGLPVLASDIPENMEVVSEAGISFENKSVGDLVNKLEQYLPEEDYLAKTGVRAKEFVIENYNWKDICQDVSGLYFDLRPECKFVTEGSAA
jgi:glycosyltransferase involved in cell wall biosynthesis